MIFSAAWVLVKAVLDGGSPVLAITVEPGSAVYWDRGAVQNQEFDRTGNWRGHKKKKKMSTKPLRSEKPHAFDHRIIES